MKPAKSKAKQPPKKAPVWPEVCVCIFLALATLAVFSQTARFQFVNFDDSENVYENPIVQKGLTANVVWALTHAQASMQSNMWESAVGSTQLQVPLTTLSHMLDCQLFGLWAGGHHLVNVLLHVATVVLLFLVLRRATGSLWRSAFVAAVFAIHPLRAESVAWVSERKDVLSGFFFMLTVWAYVNYVEKSKAAGVRRKIFYALTLVFFALGLLAKSMVATLPFVLLLLDYWPLGRMQDRRQFFQLVKEKIPFFALAVGASVVATALPGVFVKDSRQLPLLERLGNALVSCVIYLRQMAFPTGLAAPYPDPPNGYAAWEICLALALLTAISIGVVLCRKKRPALLVGWLWYVGMLFPVSGIVQISRFAVRADRYTYLPGIGFVLAVTWMVADWAENSSKDLRIELLNVVGRGSRRAASGGISIPPHEPSAALGRATLLRSRARQSLLAGLMTVVVGALGCCGYVQTSYWKDSQSLWTRALACTPGNYVAANNLAEVRHQQGRMDEALTLLQRAIEFKPDYFLARYNLGNDLYAMNDYDGAIAQFQKALESRPHEANVMNNLGNAYSAKGNLDAALAQYQKAVETEPDFVLPHNNLGLALLTKGDVDGAMAQFQKALALDPSFAEARHNLTRALLRKGDMDGALASFAQTASANSDTLTKWNNMGNDFLQKHETDEAITCYVQALKIAPRASEIYANLGTACFEKGDAKAGIESWEKSLEIKPGQLNVQNNLAFALATTAAPSLRDGPRAVQLALQANQASGGANPMILHTLAAAYAETGNYAEATTTAQRALTLAQAQNIAAVAQLQKEIQLYQANTPLRQPAR